MVRKVLWLLVGALCQCLFMGPAFPEDSLPQLNRLNLLTQTAAGSCRSSVSSASGLSSVNTSSQSSPCSEFSRDVSLARFDFAMKHEPFTLQSVRDMPSLANQGGGNLLQASNDIQLHEILSAGIQMVYRDPFVTSNSVTPLTHRMGAQVVLKGMMAQMKYQAEYGYSGQETGAHAFVAPNDQLGGKLTWEWDHPFVTPKIMISRFTNNVDGDVTRGRTIANEQNVSLNWTIPNWPSLALSYGREQREFFARPDGPLSDAITTERVKARLSFEHAIGKGYWSSYYRTSTSEYWEGAEEEIGSTISGTLHLLEPLALTPQWGFSRRGYSGGTLLNDRIFANLGSTVEVTPTLSITPGLHFVRTLNRFDAFQSNTLSAKLGYSYLASDDSLDVSILGQYILNQTSQASSHPQMYDISFLVNKNMQEIWHLHHRQQILSVKIVHNQQVNSLSSHLQPIQTSALVLVSIIP